MPAVAAARAGRRDSAPCSVGAALRLCLNPCSAAMLDLHGSATGRRRSEVETRTRCRCRGSCGADRCRSPLTGPAMVCLVLLPKRYSGTRSCGRAADLFAIAWRFRPADEEQITDGDGKAEIPLRWPRACSDRPVGVLADPVGAAPDPARRTRSRRRGRRSLCSVPSIRDRRVARRDELMRSHALPSAGAASTPGLRLLTWAGSWLFLSAWAFVAASVVIRRGGADRRRHRRPSPPAAGGSS